MRSVLITGACGGIGRSLVTSFCVAGWRVIATDIGDTLPPQAHSFIRADLEKIVGDSGALHEFAVDVRGALGGAQLGALVNNAATQILGRAECVTLDDWERSLRVNLTAPFLLSQTFLPDLESSGGTIINIGSVHAQATKPGFVVYATTKAAIHGLTKSLAVDVGPRVRVVCLAPAAIATPMLHAGFEGNLMALEALAQTHPLGRIGEPSEVGEAAVALAGKSFLFATGSVFWLDGGILARLHDPA